MVGQGMKRYLHIDVLCILFGIGTWLCVNGLWVELPLLVQHLPEGWALPAYLSVVIQLANLGPVAYTILNKFFPTIVTETRSIYAVMLVGFTAVVLLANFWNVTENVLGEKRSVALIVLVFFVAAVDCSSRVLYLPFMARLQTIYLPSFFIGEGLSGLIPSMFALVQGVGGNPECVNSTFGSGGAIAMIPEPVFSVDLFFYIMAATTFASAVAFFMLNQHSIVEKGLSGPSISGTTKCTVVTEERSRRGPFYDSTRWSENESEAAAAFLNREDSSNQSSRKTRPLPRVGKRMEAQATQSYGQVLYLLTLQTVICGLANGIFPSIQSYSCLPYGNETYHWAVTLSNMANPAVCFLMFCLPKPNKYLVTITALVGLGVSSYVMQTAVLSPNPPLVGTMEGKSLLVISWILLVGLFTYTKVSISAMLRDFGQRGLFWSGAFTQFGSSIGALAIFFTILYGDVFHSYNPCG